MKYVFLGIMILAGFVGVSAQNCPDPGGCVTITRTAAIKALADADKVIALEKDSAVKDKALSDLKDELVKMRIEFANVSGMNTELRQNAVSDRAIITAIIPLMRKKCMPLSLCF